MHSYGAVAWCYDELCGVYSGGAIRRAKLAHLEDLEPGDRVLYAGVGRGEEAVAAARLGARVTAIDCAPAMLERLARRLDSEHLKADLVEGDVLLWCAPPGGYDTVAAHFFLNLFDAQAMRDALAHLVAMVAVGGRLAIADFAPPCGGRVARLLSRAYYAPVDGAAWAAGLAALHPIYDYEVELRRHGFIVVRRQTFRPIPAGPPLYEALVARCERR